MNSITTRYKKLYIAELYIYIYIYIDNIMIETNNQINKIKENKIKQNKM